MLASLPSLWDVIDAIRRATDTSGPVYYVLARAAGGVLSDSETGYRLPSLVATVVACDSVYAFARRDLGPEAGSVAVLAMRVSPLYHGYPVHARPYALTVMFTCVAAVAW